MTAGRTDDMAPGALQINAWVQGGGATADPSAAVQDWAIRKSGTLVPARKLFAPEPADERRWDDPDVGWGLILADDDAWSAQQKAVAADAPLPIQELLAARAGAPVLRYRDDLGVSYLMRYDADGSAHKVATAGGEPGAGPSELPRYLLIAASPATVPWRLQYMLNTSNYVGRLDLPEPGLANYVDALLHGWDGAEARTPRSVLWAVDLAPEDITQLMRQSLVDPLAATYGANPYLTKGVRCLTAQDALHAELAATLATERPAMVVTTSHGATGPLDDVDRLRADLGRPVDQHGTVLDPQQLFEHWQPDGAIWYSHACCSAGADDSTLYQDLPAEMSQIAVVLDGVTAAGARTAPFPQELLGCERPLRAFVGHVEPTFNWTLRDAENGQVLTTGLRKAFYDGVYRKVPEPIGLALARHYHPVSTFWSRWDSERGSAVGGDSPARWRALRARLAALDRQSLVVLGDPTVALPSLAATTQ